MINDNISQHLSEIPINSAQSNSLAQRYLQLSWREKIDIALGLSRGLILRRKLDTQGRIIAGSGIKIFKQNGIIRLDRLCVLSDSVQIAVKGKDEAHLALLSIGYNTHILERTKINVGTSVIIGEKC